jgi:hypothetical protein
VANTEYKEKEHVRFFSLHFSAAPGYQQQYQHQQHL